MVLTTATIYYYGIDTKTYEPKVTKLAYSQTDDCFYIDNEVHDCHIKAFEKEVVKEALYLKHNAQQQQLADKLYVSRQTVCRWENGSRCPDLITAKKLALPFSVLFICGFFQLRMIQIIFSHF